MTSMPEYLKHEGRMQKLRMVTPITLISNTVLLSIVGWFVISTYDEIKNQQIKDNTRIECLAHNIDKCCTDAQECV